MSKKNRKLIKNTPLMVVYDGKHTMNMSYNSAQATDDSGNSITVYFWFGGDWKVEYKNKEYIISMNDNVSALIDWINSQEKASQISCKKRT